MHLISILLSMIFSNNLLAASTTHQVGDVFGKEEITIDSLKNDSFFIKNPTAVKVAEATAWLTHPVHGALHTRDPKELEKLKCEKELGQQNQTCKDMKPNHGRYIGSAHLIGEFDDKLIMFTNSHLIHEKFCHDVTLQFVFLQDSPFVKCKEVIIRDESLDFAMIVVEATDDKTASLLKTKGINLSYNAPIVTGSKLYSIGFSTSLSVTPEDILNGMDPLRRSPNKTYLTRDDDCRVLSDNVQLIRNPKTDTEVFKPRHAYSFANGCDAFIAGDCGAIYVNEETQELMGMYWTEGTEPFVKTNNLGGMWNQYTYGVPASKIKELMLKNPISKEPEFKKLFSEMFQ